MDCYKCEVAGLRACRNACSIGRIITVSVRPNRERFYGQDSFVRTYPLNREVQKARKKKKKPLTQEEPVLMASTVSQRLHPRA